MTPQGIKNLRVDVDRIIAALKMGFSSWAAEEAAGRLIEARMWLGEALAELGMETPYADSLDPTNEKIAPTADTYVGDLEFTPSDRSPIKFIKELRATLVEKSEAVRQEIITGSRKQFYRMALGEAYTCLCAGRMWLGKELGRMKDQNEIPDRPGS